jgi:hypothetical protein
MAIDPSLITLVDVTTLYADRSGRWCAMKSKWWVALPGRL